MLQLCIFYKLNYKFVDSLSEREDSSKHAKNCAYIIKSEIAPTIEDLYYDMLIDSVV